MGRSDADASASLRFSLGWTSTDADVDAVVALGAVIRGETPHFEYVAGQAASGLMQAMLQTEKPIVFGVLTTNTPEEAQERAGGKAGNKGAEAVFTAIEMVRLLEAISR